MAHDCAEEICEMSDDTEKEEEETVEEQPDPATKAMRTRQIKFPETVTHIQSSFYSH